MAYHQCVGYVDRPARDPRARADAQRLRGAGVTKIHYEADDGSRRPVLRQVVQSLHEGDTLIVVALDRLGRPLQSLVRTLGGLRAGGVALQCIEGDVNLSDPRDGTAQARMIDAIVHCLAVWDASTAEHRGKTMAGTGRRPGAHPKLGAFSVEEVQSMLEQPGASRTSVAKQLGVGRTTLYRFLRKASTP